MASQQNPTHACCVPARAAARGPIRSRRASRALDLVGASLGLLLTAPLFLLLALAIRWGSPGPVFFRQRRVGRGFRPFVILKFRTMISNAAQPGAPLTLGEDPRVTRLGRFLRKTKLDELPQLINVLRGEMALVGPRPEIPRFVEMFREQYEEILQVPPGLTGLASVRYRDEAALLGQSPDPEAEYVRTVLPEKIRLAREYLRRASLRYDVWLILKTVHSLLLRPGHVPLAR